MSLSDNTREPAVFAGRLSDIEIASAICAERGYIVIGHDGAPLNPGDVVDVFNAGLDTTHYPLIIIRETDYADHNAQQRLWRKIDFSPRHPSTLAKRYYRAVARD